MEVRIFPYFAFSTMKVLTMPPLVGPGSLLPAQRFERYVSTRINIELPSKKNNRRPCRFSVSEMPIEISAVPSRTEKTVNGMIDGEKVQHFACTNVQ
jgi:hypothetical protein